VMSQEGGIEPYKNDTIVKQPIRTHVSINCLLTQKLPSLFELVDSRVFRDILPPQWFPCSE